MDDRVRQLSAKQLDVLRLVGRGLRTYEAAAELGISEAATTERLREARRVLGVSSSVAAARLVVKHELAINKNNGDTIPVIVAETERAEHAFLTEPAAELRDVQSAYADVLEVSPKRGFPWPVERAGRRTNDLTWYQILAWGLFIGFVAVSLLGAMKALQTHS